MHPVGFAFTIRDCETEGFPFPRNLKRRQMPSVVSHPTFPPKKNDPYLARISVLRVVLRHDPRIREHPEAKRRKA